MAKRRGGKKPDLDPEVQKMLDLRQSVVDALLPRYSEADLTPEQIRELSEPLVNYVTELSWSIIVEKSCAKDFTPEQLLDPEYQASLRDLKSGANVAKRTLDEAMQLEISNREQRRSIFKTLEQLVYEECGEVLNMEIEPPRQLH